MRQCERCNGTKRTAVYGDPYGATRECFNCSGLGEFPSPLHDYETIRSLIVNPKTGKTFSTSLHSAAGKERALARGYSWRDTSAASNRLVLRRAQYVWRMARWHSGADGRGANLGGAIMAEIDLGSDPYKPELDALADKIACECHGSDLYAARRWKQAMYGA